MRLHHLFIHIRAAGLAAAVAAGLVAVPASSLAGAAAADACPGWNGSQPVNPHTGTGTVIGLRDIAAIGPCDIWAVGGTASANASFPQDPLIEHWTGGSWALSPTPPLADGTVLNSVSAVSASDIWAVGWTGSTDTARSQPLILHWDGSSWTRISSPSPPGADARLLSVDALSANDVWAVGSAPATGPATLPLALHWDGARWSESTVPAPAAESLSLTRVSGTSGSDVWAAGIGGASDDQHWSLSHWDGSAWSRQPVPVPALANIWGITAVSAGNVWAVGDLGHQNLAMHWDGSGWSQVQVPNPGGADVRNSLNNVASSSGSDVWATGHYQQQGTGRLVPYVLHFDGSTWATAMVPGANNGDGNIVDGLAVPSPGQAWLAGGSMDGTRALAAPVPVVPDVAGDQVGAALATLSTFGLAGGQITGTTDCPAAQSGLIVRTDPPASNRVPFGSAVGLIRCDTPATVTVPSVLSFDDASARRAITNAGLTVGTVTMTPSCALPRGGVLTQNPRDGQQAAPGTPVNLQESTGKQANGKLCVIQ